jgi:transcriptional regulator NrdR family protein
MECPFCGEVDSGVIDSRPTKERNAIRRRRECLSCAGRFTTYEATPDQLMLLLMKTHGGKTKSMKSSEAVLSFMSNALRGLSGEFEKLMGAVAEFEPLKRVKRPKRKVAVKAKPKKRPAARKKKAAPRKPRRKKIRPKKTKKVTDTGQVLNVIKRYKKGVDIDKLKKKTGFADSKIRAIVFRANKEGKIKRIRRGVYISA